MTRSDYEATRTELVKRRDRYFELSEGRVRAAVDFYVAARLRNPDLLDLTGNSKWDELAKPAAQRGEWKTIQDCTDYQDLAILSYQLAIDALLAGDSAGADNFALLANSAEQLSVNCIQIFL